ncbi:MAG: TetR/AcrR family transcriptional regulator [Deltaproteobacteria bacterium]|nr:TetR/AcrR family transcriptional regulator [Deltaproteobacteria bacterium]
MTVREKKKERTRQQILEAAWRLFNKQGFAKTTVDQIAEQAEVGTGTVYNYFPSKEHVLAARFTEIGRDAIETFLRLDRPTKASDAISLLFDTLFPTLMADQNLLREVWSVFLLPRGKAHVGLDHGAATQLEDLDWQVIGIIASILEEARERGQLKGDFDANLAAMTIYSVFIFSLIGYLIDIYQDFKTIRSITNDAVRLIFNGLKGDTK